MKMGKTRGLALVGAGIVIGHFAGVGGTVAQTPQVKQVSANIPAADANKRVVGFIFGNIPLHRETFGEYLIARKGADKFDLFVNKCIIEHAALRKGITVTDAEIEAIIEEDAKLATIANKEEFLRVATQQYGCSIWEWKEDVIKPRLMLYKMGKENIDAIKIADEEIKARYDVLHGKRVKLKMILMPNNQANTLMRAYDEIRADEAGFDRWAKKNPNADLAARAGEVEPFSKGSSGDEQLETEAFKLQPGETSRVIQTRSGVLVMRCLGYIDGPAGDLEKEKASIEKWLRERKIEAEVPKIMKALIEEAKPQKFFQAPVKTDTELKKEVEGELKQAGFAEDLKEKK